MEDILYIVIPAYNEEENIRAVVKGWYQNLSGTSEKSRLIVADKGSTDRTHEILSDMREEGYSQLELLETESQFHGPKVIALYDYAVKNGANYIFQTDSDGQTNPDEFEEFWMLRNEYDGVFGHRNVRGDGKSRAFVEKTVVLLLKLFFGVSVPDANAPFRLMRAEVVKKYLYKMSEDYNLPNIMMTTWFAYYREKITFKTISFNARQGGTNSINIPRIVKIGWKALGDFRRFKKEMTQ